MSFFSITDIELRNAGNIATIYYEQGQLDLAIRHYKQAISRDPRFLEAYNNLVSINNTYYVDFVVYELYF